MLLVRQLDETGTTTDLSELLGEPDPNQFTTRLADEHQVEESQTRTLQAYQKAEYARADTELAAQQQLAIQTEAQTKAQNDLLSASTNLAAANSQSAALHAELADAELDEATAQSAIITLADIQGGLSLAEEQVLDVKELSTAQKLESVPIAPNAGHWTAAEGQSAADRALAWVGLPYAFDGGTATGPSVGVCTSADGGGGEQDCHVVGFDCSGLALYAWAPYESLPHYAASQYLVAGNLHPSLNELLPGDWVFWSTDRTQSGIAHVAIYLGHGDVIQAPESGDVVKITPLISVIRASSQRQDPARRRSSRCPSSRRRPRVPAEGERRQRRAGKQAIIVYESCPVHPTSRSAERDGKKYCSLTRTGSPRSRSDPFGLPPWRLFELLTLEALRAVDGDLVIACRCTRPAPAVPELVGQTFGSLSSQTDDPAGPPGHHGGTVDLSLRSGKAMFHGSGGTADGPSQWAVLSAADHPVHLKRVAAHWGRGGAECRIGRAWRSVGPGRGGRGPTFRG